MRLGLDLDGVCFDFVGAFLPYFNRRWGTRFKERELVRYEWWECLPEMTEEMFYEALRQFEADGLWYDVPLYKGVPEALTRALEQGHTLHAITVRSGTGTDAALREFKRWGIPLFDLEVPDGKRGETKGHVAERLGVSVHIEDRPRYAVQVASRGVPVLLVDQRYNRHWEPPWELRIARARDLGHALKIAPSHVRSASRTSSSRGRVT